MMKTLVAAAFLASSGVAYGQTPTAPQTRKSGTAKRDTVASSHSPRD